MANKNKLMLEAYISYNEALIQERDRRYAEVATEKEKALRIKDAGDEKALNLARDIQVYKDEKANELRSQIERERRFTGIVRQIGNHSQANPYLCIPAKQWAESHYHTHVSKLGWDSCPYSCFLVCLRQ
jgi:hypothetical protein